MADYVLVCTEDTLPIGTCSGVTTWVDMHSIEAINPLNEFDIDIFAYVNMTILISFLIGHATGRLLKWLGK